MQQARNPAHSCCENLRADTECGTRHLALRRERRLFGLYNRDVHTQRHTDLPSVISLRRRSHRLPALSCGSADVSKSSPLRVGDRERITECELGGGPVEPGVTCLSHNI
jgi:hypothetical protein